MRSQPTNQPLFAPIQLRHPRKSPQRHKQGDGLRRRRPRSRIATRAGRETATRFLFTNFSKTMDRRFQRRLPPCPDELTCQKYL